MLPAFINFHILKALSDRYFFLKVGKGSASLLPQPILMTKSKIKNFQILRQPFNWIEILLCDVTSWGFPVLKACTGKWNVTHQQ